MNVENLRVAVAVENATDPALNGNHSEPENPSTQLDMILKAWLGQFTGNISPASVANAYTDWLTHLKLSPSKQTELVQKAYRKFWRWAMHACDLSRANQSNSFELNRCIEPLPQDKRFSASEWDYWPFNLISQGFLLNQQWWHNATTGIPGVSKHHEDVVTFITRQILDMLAPSNFLLTNPVVLKETFRDGGANLLRGMQSAFVDWQQSIESKTGHLDEAFKVSETLAITPGKVVFRNNLIELIHYTPTTKSVYAVPILFVPAWIMKYYILDLSPQNSMVKYLVDKGHTVFMISWKNPDAKDRDLSMEDYRTLGIMEAIDTVTRLTESIQVSAVGYCLGGTLLSIAAAAMARDKDERLANITLFASQVDFEEPGEMSLFIDESQINFLEATMWEKGYLDSTQMVGAFQLLRSNDLIWSHRLNQYLLGKPEQKTDLMAWNADATRMPYRMHSEYLRKLFLHNDLAEGRYRVDGRVIGLSDIHIPIFAVGTTTDHVAPWHSVFKIHHLTETEVTFLLTSGGHNAGVVSPPGHPHRSYQIATRAHGDIFVDADIWQTTIPEHQGSWWPTWETWLISHAGKRIRPPAVSQALCDAPGLYIMQT